MGSRNLAILVGRVGKDPVLRNTGAGKTVASFSLATSESWKDKNSGERKERTSWHEIVIFNEDLVRVAEHHIKKGSQLYVEGKIVTRKWTDKEGKDRWTTEIVLDGFGSRIELLDKSEGGGNHAPPPEGPDDYGTSRDRAPASEGNMGAASSDDDIPF